ncbi:MAG: hypothetical protein Q9165_008803 [Trypethelium subeluteriae]
MSDAVQLQADIGSLSLHGLGAFSTILTALSADDVVPMAMIQLERLGALFHISGKFAAKVPDMLTRVKSHPLGRLAATVGWRKGDSASLLAKSAGGQAIALLSTVLHSLLGSYQIGDVLFGLSHQILPADSAICSPSQLAKASKLIAQKLSALGFGNFLAEQIVRVFDTYRSLNMDMPPDLLDGLTVDASVALLKATSEALQEEDKLVRTSGTSGIGNILGLILFLFPHDTTVTVDDTIIQEEAGILCLFISAGPNVGVTWSASFRHEGRPYGSGFMKLLPSSLEYVNIKRLPDHVFRLVSGVEYPNPSSRLIASAGSTIYYALLPTLELPLETKLSFELLDGNLEFNHRYHPNLHDIFPFSLIRPKAKKSITQDQVPFEPSNMGAPSKLFSTIRETSWDLEFRLSARYDNTNVDVSLRNCILSSCFLKRTVACLHPVSSTFTPTVDDNIVLTSIASPCAEEERAISIVMTNRDRTAQLLCCDDRDVVDDKIKSRGKKLLMQNCCLSCAVTQAKQGGFEMIIVS